MYYTSKNNTPELKTKIFRNVENTRLPLVSESNQV